ncbi:hypothetical protein BKA70DRAFT_676671 [Coprinopsis sp. MPI-PUGE-AT-0042]|nr:hypothetical protein BKA70DRAFT_676671 [Coprinopsis sp. MPI-PUGE-AT-0042]
MADVLSAKEQVLQGLVGEDILPLVFENLCRTPVMDKGNGDLRNAALACKAFSQHALDLLWHTLTSLDPLLPFVMPPNEPVSLSSVYIRQPACPRFDSYRKRVHRLLIVGIPRNSSMANWSAGCKAVVRMCHILQQDSELNLFPNLKYIYLKTAHNQDMDALNALIPFLLTPSLLRVTLHGLLPLERLFPLVAISCPSTQFLAVGFERSLSPEGTIETIPLERLSALKQLKSLTVSASWNVRRIVKISSIHYLLLRLPYLRHLSLNVHRIKHDLTSSVDYDSLVAPLKTFVLDYHPINPTKLQPLHSLPKITSLTLSLDASLFTSQDVASFVLTVALQPRLSSYAMRGVGRPNANLLTINVGDILPLFSSKTLKTIILSGFILTHQAAYGAASFPTSITLPPFNPIVESIIGALNRPSGSPVVELYFPDIISPLLTFDSLMRFAEDAQRLTKLWISVSGSVPSGFDTQLKGPTQVRFTENSLKSLTIVNNERRFSPDDYPLLARCVDSWFPHLEIFNFLENDQSIQRIGELRSECQRARLLA